LRLGPIEALMHFLSSPEVREGFLFDRHNGAGAGVAAGTGAPFPDRKRPETANFDPVSPAQRFVDRARGRIDETLNITPIEMRILCSDASNKLGFDHRVAAPAYSQPGSIGAGFEDARTHERMRDAQHNTNCCAA
jgi:hypothetical protein